MIDLVERIRPADGVPQGALILLHGRGADEHDLLPLLEVLDPDQRLVGVTPRAILAGDGGFHWYDSERIGVPDAIGYGTALTALERWRSLLPERLGVPWERCIVGGFSQGATMAYGLGLTTDFPPPAAVIALAGFLPQVAGFPLDLQGPERPPLTLAHGVLDPVIDVSLGRAARDVLLGAGLDVGYRETPVAHTIDPAWLPVLRARIAAALGATESG